ncbi:hypothetical protein AN1V17_47500 [Vallitalea sediminicola]
MNIKKISTLCLALIMVMSISINVKAADEMEPNDSLAQANMVELTSVTCGIATDNQDNDYYRTKILSEDRDVHFLFIHQATNDGFVAWIYDETTGDLLTAEIMTSKVTEKDFRFKKGHRYYIRVLGLNGSSNTTYQLSLTDEEIGHLVLKSSMEEEPNNTQETANICPDMKQYIGSIKDSSDVDYFEYTATESQQVRYQFLSSGTENAVFTYMVDDATGEIIHQGTIIGNTYTPFYMIANHKYRVYVEYVRGNKQSYAFQFKPVN